MKSISSFVKYLFPCLLFLLGTFFPFHAEGAMFLRDRLQSAEVGDYIVTAIDKTYTALIVKEKSENSISIEEITIPAARLQYNNQQWRGWKQWVQNGAPGNTSWVVYTIDKSSGEMRNIFSYTKNSWCHMSEENNFLSKLLNLRMMKIPQRELKKVGPPPTEAVHDNRRLWAPKMVFEGNVVRDATFEAWRTRWPKDSTDLSGKLIIVYVPQDSHKYPAYFPYWLEIHGMLGKAKVRIIDSGRELASPRPLPR